ncbi:helix-turn-helix domain-containing protein [Streptomyces gelaticus]
MTVKELGIEPLSDVERLSTWRKEFARALESLQMRTTHAADFQAKLRLVDLGTLRVSTLTCPPLEALRRDSPGQYALVLNRGETLSVADEHRTVTLAPGDLTFCDMSRPFTMSLAADPSRTRPVSVLAALFPGNLLSGRHGDVKWRLGTLFPGREAMVSLVSRHLHDLVRHAGRWSASDRVRLAATTGDLIATLLTREPESGRPPFAAPTRLSLQTRIHSYIQQHLGDPGLGPRAVAAAHQVSVRHLHQLFHEQGLTVAAWIRRCRLDRCRQELTDARHHERPIHAIAARWGFGDAAHFSRLFRTTYGITPSEYRADHAVRACLRGAHEQSKTF